MKYRCCWLLAACTLGVTSPAAAQELFDAAVTLPASSFTNYIQLADLDGDGDLDIMAPNCSGFMATGPQALEVYRNDGSGNFTDYGFPLAGTKAVRQVAFGDIDQDGDIDVYVPDAATGAHLMYVNGGTGNFTDEGSTRLPSAFISRTGAARFADVDNDGDLDLFVGDAYSTAGAGPIQGHMLMNDGTGVFSEGAAMPTGGGEDPIDVDFADVDRDWDLDIVLNMHLGKSLLWLNDGTGVFADATAGLHDMSGFHYGPSLCDIDADGDVDMWTDNAGPGLADILATNDGNGVFTDMTATLVSGNSSSADDNGVVCVDYDHDGDFDGTVVSLSTRERMLVNTDGSFQFVANVFPASAQDQSLWMDYGDLDGDGRLDAVTGQGEPSSPNKIFLANSSMTVDNRAPDITAVEAVSAEDSSDTPAVRFTVSDAVSSDTGPRLQRAYVQVEGASSNEVEAQFSGGDVFRAVLPTATDGSMVTYTCCAVDRQGNEGCADPLSYVVGRPVGTGGAGGTSGSGGNAASGGSAGGADDGDFPLPEDSGCGCGVVGDEPNDGRSAILLLLAGLGIAVAHRRRQR